MNARFRYFFIILLAIFGTVLLLAGVVTTVIIVQHGDYCVQLDPEGFQRFRDLFDFPIICVGAAFAIMTLIVAVSSLSRSHEQLVINVNTTKKQTLLSYYSTGHSLPVALIYKNSAFKDQQSVSCEYQAPAYTVQHLYAEDPERGYVMTQNPAVSKSLSAIYSHADNIRHQLYPKNRNGDDSWVNSLFKMYRDIHKLRRSLALSCDKMLSVDGARYSTKIDPDLDERYSIQVIDDTFSGLMGYIFLDAMLIADALFIAPLYEEDCRRIFEIGELVFTLDQHPSLQKAFRLIENVDLDRVLKEKYNYFEPIINPQP